MGTFIDTSVPMQAKRVYDHIQPMLGEEVMKVMNFTQEKFEKQIRQGCSLSGMTPKQMADTLIKMWDYTENETKDQL